MDGFHTQRETVIWKLRMQTLAGLLGVELHGTFDLDAEERVIYEKMKKECSVFAPGSFLGGH